MEIRTDRLLLRPLRREDAPAIAAGCADPDVPRFIPFVPENYSADDAEAFLEIGEELIEAAYLRRVK